MKNKSVFYAFMIMIALIIIIILSIDLDDNKGTNKSKKKEEFSYTPLMYKVCDSDSCIYLLGSIHLGDDKVNKFNQVVIDAYNNSDILAVELEYELDDVAMDDMYLEDGKLVKELISSELDKTLKKFSEEHPMFSYDLYNNLKLGYLNTILSVIPYMELGYMNPGVDSYFIDLAHGDKKEIISLETYEEQMKLLLNNSDEFYIKQIEDIIDNYDDYKEEAITLYDTYLKGDEEKLKDLVSISLTGDETEEEKQYIEAMYDDRNKKMTDRVKEFLETNQKVFMTVGAAHVSGSNGIIDRLGNDYKVSIVK